MEVTRRQLKKLVAVLVVVVALFACPSTALASQTDDQLSINITPSVPCYVKPNGEVITASKPWTITNNGAEEVSVSAVTAKSGEGAENIGVTVTANVDKTKWFSYSKGIFAAPTSEKIIPGNGSIQVQWDVTGKFDIAKNAAALKQAVTAEGYNLVSFSFTFKKKEPEAFAVLYAIDRYKYEAKLYKRDKIPEENKYNIITVIKGIEDKEEIFGDFFDGNVNRKLSKVTVVDEGIRPKTMKKWFYYKGSLEEANLEKLDASNITDMSEMFKECGNLRTLVLPAMFDGSKVTNMKGMFQNCRNLISLSFPPTFNTSNVPDMNGMFYACSSLTSLDLSKFNTSNVEDMGSMFKGCSSLSSLDLSGWDTKKVTRWDWFPRKTSIPTQRPDFLDIKLVKLTGNLWSYDGLQQFPSKLCDKNGISITNYQTISSYKDAVEFTSSNKRMTICQAENSIDFNSQSTEAEPASQFVRVDAIDTITAQDPALDPGKETDAAVDDEQIAGVEDALSPEDQGTSTLGNQQQESLDTAACEQQTVEEHLSS